MSHLPHNSHPAQIVFRAAKAAADATEAAFDAVDCENVEAMNAAEAAFDAANSVEESAGTALIRWMRADLISKNGPVEALVAIDMALLGNRAFRARVLDLAERFAA